VGTETIKTPFTGDEEADQLLTENPFALLVGMLLDQQVPMEWAFRGPLELKRRLGSLDAAGVAALDPDRVREVFSEKPALHRYPGSMGARVHDLAGFIVERYAGRAERIWTEATDADDLFGRLRELPGYGDQKARIFVAILGKRLKVAPSGWEERAGTYGEIGYRSIADVDGPGAVERVRAFKQAMKAKNKTVKK